MKMQKMEVHNNDQVSRIMTERNTLAKQHDDALTETTKLEEKLEQEKKRAELHMKDAEKLREKAAGQTNKATHLEGEMYKEKRNYSQPAPFEQQ